MTKPNSATANQWDEAGVFATPTRACLMELRARVEALEARDREDAAGGSLRLPIHARLSPADYSIGESVDLAKLDGRVEEARPPETDAAQPAEPQSLHSEALEMVDFLGRTFGILPEILDTLRRAIREPMQGEASVKDFLTAQPQPVSSPVDAVADAMCDITGESPELWRNDAATAVIAVATWLEQQSPDAISTGRGWAKLLRQEVQADE